MFCEVTVTFDHQRHVCYVVFSETLPSLEWVQKQIYNFISLISETLDHILTSPRLLCLNPRCLTESPVEQMALLVVKVTANSS